MSAITKFMLKDVRCFAGLHELEIRPLTFLVGENSTGKSTVLGCLHALASLLHGERRGEIDFNIEPYRMGAFSDIARRIRGRERQFQLGLELQLDKEKKMEYWFTLVERESGSEPIIQEIRIFVREGEIIFSNQRQASIKESLKLDKEGISIGILEEGANGEEPNRFVISTDASLGADLPQFMLYENALFDLLFLLKTKSKYERASQSDILQSDVFQKLRRLLEQSNLLQKHPSLIRYDLIERIRSIAPIRSRPQRTYDALKETESPEGEEIPVRLMNLSGKRPEDWEYLKNQLADFGRTSGLFSDIDIRKLGRSSGDPFQLQIKVKGPKVNIMDVGYGVSQILPILVYILAAREEIFLLQQPEVHLHPKGQAALSSLLVDMIRQPAPQEGRSRRRGVAGAHSFIIETHSDYMIDRARIEILKGKLDPSNISLIYLEPYGNQVKVSNISFDRQANMINAPASYRNFFLDEAKKLLGFEQED